MCAVRSRLQTRKQESEHAKYQRILESTVGHEATSLFFEVQRPHADLPPLSYRRRTHAAGQYMLYSILGREDQVSGRRVIGRPWHWRIFNRLLLVPILVDRTSSFYFSFLSLCDPLHGSFPRSCSRIHTRFLAQMSTRASGTAPKMFGSWGFKSVTSTLLLRSKPSRSNVSKISLNVCVTWGNGL